MPPRLGSTRPTSATSSRWSRRPSQSSSEQASAKPKVAVAEAGYWYHEQLDSEDPGSRPAVTGGTVISARAFAPEAAFSGANSR
jgi:hypothetical protein